MYLIKALHMYQPWNLSIQVNSCCYFYALYEMSFIEYLVQYT